MIHSLCNRLLHRTGPYADLLLVASYTTVVASVLQSPGWLGPTARIPVALPVLLFAPGYALVTAIFPSLTVESVTSDSRAPPTRPRNRLNGLVPVERVTLAVVASASGLPMVLYGLSMVTRIRLSLICAVAATVTVGCCAVAAGRRTVTGWEPPVDGGLGREVLDIESRIDVLPVLAAVVAVVLVTVAGVVVLDGNGATANAELAIGTENAAGNVTIEGYQASISRVIRVTTQSKSNTTAIRPKSTRTLSALSASRGTAPVPGQSGSGRLLPLDRRSR